MKNNHIQKPITLTERAYDQIRRGIIVGEYTAGQKISEVELCEKYQISRSPIRGALSILISEGLIIGGPNKSNVVWNPTENDVHEVISLRTVLESLASEWAFDNITEGDINHMQELIEKQEAARREKDTLKLISLDRFFHWIFVSKSAHSRLKHHWNMLMNQWEVLTHIRFKHLPEISNTVIPDHKRILEAFINKDLNKINVLHKEINERVTYELIETLKKEWNLKVVKY